MGCMGTVGGAGDMVNRSSVDVMSVMLELGGKRVWLRLRVMLVVVWMVGDAAMMRMVAGRLLLVLR